jgi:hypothetical protein
MHSGAVWDPRIDVDPREKCALCREPLVSESQIIAVLSGRMGPMKKDPNFLIFRREPDEGQPIVSVFHAHCVLTRFDLKLLWGEDSGTRCHCGKRFVAGSEVFKLVVGTIDLDTYIFVPSDRPRTSGIICADCAYDGFGEGDRLEGQLLLQATG